MITRVDIYNIKYYRIITQVLGIVIFNYSKLGSSSDQIQHLDSNYSVLVQYLFSDHSVQTEQLVTDYCLKNEWKLLLGINWY